jgi:hypothetical protein
MSAIIAIIGRKRNDCADHLHKQDPAGLSDREKEARDLGARGACYDGYNLPQDQYYQGAAAKYDGEIVNARQQLEEKDRQMQSIKKFVWYASGAGLFMKAGDYLFGKK